MAFRNLQKSDYRSVRATNNGVASLSLNCVSRANSCSLLCSLPLRSKVTEKSIIHVVFTGNILYKFTVRKTEGKGKVKSRKPPLNTTVVWANVNNVFYRIPFY